jgi:hypothetical protein
LSAGTLKAGSFANAGFFNQTGGSATITGNATSVGAVLLSNGGKLGVGGSYTQSSGFTLLNNATLSAGGGVAVNGGLFGGFGTVNGNVTVSHAAIRIGASPDALTINGNFAQTGGTITFEVDSDGHGGFLTSTLVLGQNFTFELQDAKVDFSFQNGADAIAFEDSGEFDLDTFFRIADANAPGGTDPLSDILPPGVQLDSLFTGDTFAATATDQSLNDVVTFDANGGAPVLTVASSVPEPESLALLLPGLSLVFFLRRSRRARALVLAG